MRNGLYRGLTLNYLKTMPNVAIYMSLYDIVKLALRRRAGDASPVKSVLLRLGGRATESSIGFIALKEVSTSY